MDEINMEGLELPELPDLPDLPDLPEISGMKDFGKSEEKDSVKADDIIAEAEKKAPEAVKAAEPEDIKISDAAPVLSDMADEAAQSVQDVEDYDLESIDASSLISDMDGNTIDAVADMGNFHPEKLYVSKENRFHSMQAEAEKKAAEERANAQKSYMEQQNQHKRYSSDDYSNQNVGSYRYNEKGENKSLESLYEHQFDMDPVIAEKGRKKAELITLVGFIIYGVDALSALISIFNGYWFSVIELAIDAFILICLFRFRQGSRKSREILGWLSVFELVLAIRGIFGTILGGSILSMLPGIGWLLGFLAVIIQLAKIGVSGWLAFMFFADDDIAEYTKTMKDGGFDLFK